MCEYVYHEYACALLCTLFSCFTCYLGLTMTTPFFLFPIMMFNKAHIYSNINQPRAREVCWKKDSTKRDSIGEWRATEWKQKYA